MSAADTLETETEAAGWTPAHAPRSLAPVFPAVAAKPPRWGMWIAAATAAVVAVAAIGYAVYHFKTRYVDWGEAPLVDLAGAAPVFGAAASAPPVDLFVARPYSADMPNDYFGVIEITETAAAAVHTSTTDGYFEVVVYEYPSWNIVYAETCVSELPLDFLDPGMYTVLVFSAVPASGKLVHHRRNRARERPQPRAHRSFSRDIAMLRDDAIESVITHNAPEGHARILCQVAAPVSRWPAPVYTHMESLFVVVPPHATHMFVSLPAYGIIIEGAREHIHELVHSGDGTSIHRAVARPLSAAGRRPQGLETVGVETALPETGVDAHRLMPIGGVDHYDSTSVELPENALVVSLTVVYPDMDPKSVRDSHGPSPRVALFVFADDESIPRVTKFAAECPEAVPMRM